MENWKPITLFILLIVFTILAGWFSLMPWSWLATMAIMLAFLGGLGVSTKKGWGGILIDERNKMSLSRFQMVLWTVLILSAYLVVAIQRVKYGASDPVAVGIPQLLWAQMGISTTSLVGSALVKDTKRDKTPTPDAVTRAAQPQQPDGILCVNRQYSDAKLTDIFTGEEVGNCGNLELGKVQMFYFTLIAVIAYAVALFGLMQANVQTPGNLTEFPALSEGLIALLAISHAGYLANKAVDHTQTQPQSSNGS